MIISVNSSLIVFLFVLTWNVDLVWIVKRLVSSKAMKCFYFSKDKTQDDEAKTRKFGSATMARGGSGSEFNSDTSTATSITSSLHVLSETHSNNLKVFVLDDLKTATKNFSRSLMIGEGGFGGVFRGVIQNPQDSRKKIDIAVKQLSRRGLQASKSFSLSLVCFCFTQPPSVPNNKNNYVCINRGIKNG